MYLSPEEPRWTPTSEADLEVAAIGGLLDESHYLELKREIPIGKGPNKELARDLAQFAIDGGTLLIGLAESADGGPPSLAAVELAGLPERIEQIARSIPDPPLPVTTRVIPSAEVPSRGYLLVSVPASGTAPHMVDGVYYGRGDKTKIRLGDAEVLRHHRSRKGAEQLALEVLDAYVRRDPVPPDRRQQAHMFLVAAPVAPRPEMLLDAVHGRDWHSVFHRLKMAGLDLPEPLNRDRFAPDLGYAGTLARRSDGAAAAYGLTEDRQLESLCNEARFNEDVLELELSEDGIVRLLTTRLSDGPRESNSLFASMIPVLTRRVLGVAAAVSDHCGYRGPWALGVAALGIAGHAAYSDGRLSAYVPRLALDHDEYKATTTASYAELIQTPGAITMRLVGRLLRSLGEADALRDFMTDPDLTDAE